GPEQDRDHLETAGGEEHPGHQDLQQAGALALRAEQLADDAAHPDFTQAPPRPAREEHERHGHREVDVGIGAAQQWLVDDESRIRPMSPADRSDARHETHPVGGEDEDEHAGEEPERALDQMPPDDPLEESVQALDEPLEEVLGAG